MHNNILWFQINLKANLPDARFHVADDTNGAGGLKITAEGVLRTSDHIGRDLIIVSVQFFSIAQVATVF